MFKKSLFLFCLLFFMLFSTCFAQAQQTQPLKVAIMPVVTDVSGQKNVKAQLYSALKQQMHIPLMIHFKPLNTSMQKQYILQCKNLTLRTSKILIH